MENQEKGGEKMKERITNLYKRIMRGKRRGKEQKQETQGSIKKDLNVEKKQIVVERQRRLLDLIP